MSVSRVSRPPTVPEPFDGNYTPVTNFLSAMIKREMKSEKLTGLSIALVNKQKMIWSKGFGLANKANLSSYATSSFGQKGSVIFHQWRGF